MADNDSNEIGTKPSRSIEEIKELASIAGVSTGKGLIQTLAYSSDWMKEDYKLLELSNDLNSILHEGGEITIRGDKGDDTVLCSRDKTFELRAADTSNTLLLIPELSTPGSSDFPLEVSTVKRPVLSCFSTYYEVRLIQPRLERLKNILDQNAYSNSQDDDEKEKYTTEDLLELIQSSTDELKKALDTLGGLLINGYWRIMDINYRDKAFAQILALVEEKSWDWHKIPLQPTCDILEVLYPYFVIEYCLQTYGTKVEDEDDMEGDIFSLDEEKVCRYYAEYILRPALGKFNYHEFMEAWEQSVPDGMRITEGYLSGIALTDLQTHPPVIWHFSERNLPENPSDRFNILFKIRTKWKEKDIVPYLKNLLSPGQKLSSLFLKYTRCSTDASGGKIYNSKNTVT